MALNATTCYNKSVAAGGYGSYPSPLAAAAGVPSAVMVAAAAAAVVSGTASGRGGGTGGLGASSGSRSSGSRPPGSGPPGAGYRLKDFNVPLHVDCSVEYEMPSSAKPPVGGKVEPLLMIHPSYYRKAESRTRSLFVNNMPAASVPSSGRTRPLAATVVAACNNRAVAAVQDAVAADGPPPAKRPYAGPAPGVTASTGGVYGMVTGAVAAAAGASQWPPLGSSAEHQHHDGKLTMDMVQRQYQQHMQASLPPPMLTAALPTDKTHMTG